MRTLARTALSTVAACATVVGALSCGTPGPLARYNVILVTLDTTRADHLGCYGYDRPTSPTLDNLAREGTLFEQAISQAAVTPVSHASILTGLNPYHHGLRVMHGLVANRLPEDRRTLAEVWRDTGGATGAFVSAFPASAAFGLDQGFERFSEDFPAAGGDGLVSPKGVVKTGMSQRRAEDTTDDAIAWLQDHAADDRPFLMWVHYFDPHDPLLTPELSPEYEASFAPPSDARADVLRSVYDSEIAYMDAQLGRLLGRLGELDHRQDTILVVVADHGEGLGDHDWWTHGILYHEQIRVPLIIHVPGVPGGNRFAARVRTIDVMPTILAEAGIAPEAWPAMDGQPLSGALRDRGLPQPLEAYSESVNMLNYMRPDAKGRRDVKDDKLYCLLAGPYKYIHHQLRPEESELFDLVHDPHELANLAPQGLAALDGLSRELRRRDVFSPIMPGMTATDLERERKLRSLGYVE